MTVTGRSCTFAPERDPRDLERSITRSAAIHEMIALLIRCHYWMVADYIRFGMRSLYDLTTDEMSAHAATALTFNIYSYA